MAPAVPLPAALIPRLARLVLMLSSDQAGEVVAAAAAIDRALKAAGHTWHDLGAALTALSVEQPAPLSVGIVEMLDTIGNRESWLTAWEREFVASIRQSHRQYGRLTPKQQAVLTQIFQKVA